MKNISDWKFVKPCVIPGYKGVGAPVVFFKACRGEGEEEEKLDCAITVDALECLGLKCDEDSELNLLNFYMKHKKRIHELAEILIDNGKLHTASKTYLITSKLIS